MLYPVDPEPKEAKAMKTFTIDSENNITVYTSAKAAKEAGTGLFFSEGDNLAELLGADSKRLVEIWNTIPGNLPVKKFTSLAVAQKRLMAAISNLTTGEAEAPEEIATEAATNAPAAESKPVRKAKATKPAKAAKPAKEAKPAKTPKAKKAKSADADAGTSKKDQVLALISRKDGASLEEIMTATGWQKHTVRGFIAIIGKKGTKIESFKSEAGARTYRVA